MLLCNVCKQGEGDLDPYCSGPLFDLQTHNEEQERLIRAPHVPDMLKEAARVYEERDKQYGENYFKTGGMLETLFPDGLKLETKDDFNRFAILVHLTNKLTRYASSFEAGGHEDSLVDLSVYAQILRKIDKNEIGVCLV